MQSCIELCDKNRMCKQGLQYKFLSFCCPAWPHFQRSLLVKEVFLCSAHVQSYYMYNFTMNTLYRQALLLSYVN